ncbi:tyrosine-type recombinase/integrase [Xanthomonas euroxanthea]|uniref:Tyrosine recombinase XerC n=1 Tax=Xanthomonas euroxanthea TaxID=2259622 RepID=A0AA46CBE0_9XANT|nr:tyrosine-type recombinase/integrase [Xanthomonas euroxanthea]CAE1139594.1 tyrosine-type recombinase/integrase [Xanthomonas euroxanthea]SUZ29896.1 Tyrosine recombinase XerC [Xanthomonas euroxanthea]
MNSQVPLEIRQGRDALGRLRPYLLLGGIPLLLPNLWISGLPTRRENTLDAYLRDLVPLFRWARESALNIEDRLRRGVGFREFELSQIAERMTKTGSGHAYAISTINRKIEALRSFFEFAIDYSSEVSDASLEHSNLFRTSFEAQQKKLFKKMRAHKNESPEPGQSEELTEEQIRIILAVIHPLSDTNPFSSMSVRVRNYCIVRVAIEVLARRAELVLMEVADVILSKNPELTIKSPGAGFRSKRRDRASMKTRGRTVPITSSTAAALTLYIEEYRDQLMKSRRPTTALFVSNKDGRRLTVGAINQILSVVSAAPEVALHVPRLHPHSLRVAGANRARREMRNGGVSTIDQIESLSFMGGWRQESPMVRKYTRVAISENLKIVINKDGE